MRRCYHTLAKSVQKSCDRHCEGLKGDGRTAALERDVWMGVGRRAGKEAAWGFIVDRG